MEFDNVDVVSLRNGLYTLRNNMITKCSSTMRLKDDIRNSSSWNCMAKDNVANALEKMYTKESELLSLIEKYFELCTTIEKYQSIYDDIKVTKQNIEKLNANLYKIETTYKEQEVVFGAKIKIPVITKALDRDVENKIRMENNKLASMESQLNSLLNEIKNKI